MVYYLGIATLIFMGYFTSKNSDKYLNAMLCILFMFIALHNPYITGTDGRSYRAYFKENIPTLFHFSEYNHTYEIGYALLNSLAKTIYNDYFIFQLIYSFIAIFLLGLVLKKTKLADQEKLLLLFVYFCYRFFQNNMEFLRQNIAILFIWLAVLSVNDYYQEKGKDKIKYLLTIIAWTFHRSAIFNLILLPLIERLKRINAKKLVIITSVASFGILFLGNGVISKIVQFAIVIGGERYASYLISPGEVVLPINLVNYGIRYVFYIMYFLSIDNYEYSKKKTILVVASLAIICGSINQNIFTRLLEYYMIGIYIAIVKSKHLMTAGRSRNLYLLILYVAFMIILARNLMTVSSGTYMNYQLYPFK